MANDDFGKSFFSAAATQDQTGGNNTSVDDQLADLNQRLIDLEDDHINLETDLQGLFETVSAAPTGVPKIAYDQIKIYVNGATLRFYWYDTNAHVWHYVTATA